MSRYPIYAQKKIVLDAEQLELAGASPNSITYNNSRVLTGGTDPTKTSIANISGITVAGGVAVVVNGSGLLGTVVSSKKRKREIENLPKAEFEKLYLLTPKRFKMNEDETNEIHYGLIAEEVDEIMKECCIYDENGAVTNVQYHKFTAPLISIVQDHNKKILQLESEIQQLKEQLKQ
jgi:hypothetical protein